MDPWILSATGSLVLEVSIMIEVRIIRCSGGVGRRSRTAEKLWGTSREDMAAIADQLRDRGEDMVTAADGLRDKDGSG